MSLEGVMPNNSRQRKTNIIRSRLHVESKKKRTEFIETDSRLEIIMGGGAE